MPFSLGCQTITFGGDQAEHLPNVLEAVGGAGFDGVEIGFRHLFPTPPEELSALLADAGLALAGSHIGGNLEDVSQADGEKQMLDEVLDYLNAVGVDRLMYSGLRGEGDRLGAEIDILNRAAEKCVARGVRLCYHNHDWEFQDGGRIMKALLAGACPALWFCPDVGWVHKGGAVVVDFLAEVKGRIGFVHFKDFASVEGERRDFVELGEGVVPLAQIAAWFRVNTENLWIVAEQDVSNLPAAEAVRRNGAFLRRLFNTRSVRCGG